MKKIFVGIILPLLLVAVGILWLFMGIDTMKKHNSYPQTTAVISNIYSDDSGADEDTNYHVFVTFTADGQEYEAELGQYVTGYKVGKEVEISYNPENPNEIQPAGVGSSLLMLIGGPVIALVGVGLLVKRILTGA